MTTLDEWLSRKEFDILRIRDRLDVLKPLEPMVSGQKIANRHVWSLVVDSYEMLVIDLASFFTGLLEQGGAGLNQLNNHLSQLTPGRRPKDPSHGCSPKERADLYFSHQAYDSKLEAFRRLFPDCTRDRPQQTDVQKLKDRIEELSDRCRDARNNVHAHRYENEGKQKAVTPMQLSEIEALFVEVQNIFNDLRLVALSGHFGYGEIYGEKEIAMDLRELILHGTINHFCSKLGLGNGTVSDRYYWQLRDEFYGGDTTADSPSPK